MSDTTEAMRAAVEKSLVALETCKAFGGPEGTRQYFHLGRVFIALDAVRAALAHPTPAAPAVTDSTHTGTVPADATFRAWLGQSGYTSSTTLMRAGFDGGYAAGLAAQPPPERNDCEPVTVIEQKTPKPKPLSKDPAPGSEFWIAMYGKADGPHYWGGGHWDRVALGAGNCYATQAEARDAAPPPPAERHYCERCGKRLGSTLGVHTCTPPGDDPVVMPRNPTADMLREARELFGSHVEDTESDYLRIYERFVHAATKAPEGGA